MLKIAAVFGCYMLFIVTVITSKEICLYKICENDSSYPHQEIEEASQASGFAIAEVFGDLKPASETSRRSTRSICEICPSTARTILRPLSLLVEGNQKLYIMNTKKYPLPQIELQICSKNDKQCKISDLPDGYGTECVQRNSQLNVIAYNSTTKNFEGRAVSFPSHCECIIFQHNSSSFIQ